MEYASTGRAGQPANSVAGSRIEQNVEQVKEMALALDRSTDRIIRHARALGYYEPTPEKQSAPTPVITTMADALQALNYAIDRNSGALNVFD